MLTTGSRLPTAVRAKETVLKLTRGGARNASPDGGTLTLVRLRLRLALMTMAIVPVVISMALIFAVMDGQGLDQRARATDEAGAISAAVTAAVQRTEGMVLATSSDRNLAQLIADPSSSGIEGPTTDSLIALGDAGGPLVSAVRLADASGHDRLVSSGGVVSAAPATATEDRSLVREALSIDAGQVFQGAAVMAPNGEVRVPLVAPLIVDASSQHPVGLLVVDVSLPEVVRQVTAHLDDPDAIALVVDRSTGAVIGDSRSPGNGDASSPGPTDLSQRLKDMASGQDIWSGLLSEGWAGANDALATGSVGNPWSIVVLAPSGPPMFPLQLIVVLATLCVVGVVLAIWMSHQILRPAEDMEQSQQRLQRAYEQARAESLHDGLTGLGNHRAFQEELQRQVDWYGRYHVPISLLLLDLDDLKVINDSNGHGAGDEQLQRLSVLIRKAARFSDRAFRIGGDEFAILLPHTDIDGAMRMAQRLLKSAMSGDRPVAFSGGLSSCPELAQTKQDLYSQADAALYWCKRHGRASVEAFDASRDMPITEAGHDEQTAALVSVITERKLRAVFQPVVDMTTGAIVGYEGLTRPTETEVFANPGVLFEAAEECGRTVELDAACFDVVVETAARTIPADKLVTVNLSPRTLESQGFSVAQMKAILEHHGLAVERLVVELTERENVLDVAQLRNNLVALRAAGIRIAADDVGAGNAGLRLLSQFRFDIVKLDLSLVQEGAERDSSQAVLRSLRDLAQRWGSFVIAEGIETREQLKIVRGLGIGAGQGYLLGRPGTNVEIDTLDLDELESGGMVMQNSQRASASAQVPAA
jgi:diguanylate cyclase (GGDEF)-like protein